jgi:hypothetical protein
MAKIKIIEKQSMSFALGCVFRPTSFVVKKNQCEKFSVKILDFVLSPNDYFMFRARELLSINGLYGLSLENLLITSASIEKRDTGQIIMKQDTSQIIEKEFGVTPSGGNPTKIMKQDTSQIIEKEFGVTPSGGNPTKIEPQAIQAVEIVEEHSAKFQQAVVDEWESVGELNIQPAIEMLISTKVEPSEILNLGAMEDVHIELMDVEEDIPPLEYPLVVHYYKNSSQNVRRQKSLRLRPPKSVTHIQPALTNISKQVESYDVEKTYPLTKLINFRQPITERVHISMWLDYATGELLPLNDKLRMLFMDDTYYFHGTKGCNAFGVLRNGFQQRTDVPQSGAMLGPGIYFSDNIEKTYIYGSMVFVVTLNISNMLLVTDEMIDSPIVSEHDTRFYSGTFDRYGSQNHTVPRRSKYNEYCVRDAKNIQIKYVLKLDRYPPEVQMPREDWCYYDIQQDIVIYESNNELTTLLGEMEANQLFSYKGSTASLFYLVLLKFGRNRSERVQLPPGRYTFSVSPEAEREDYNKYFLIVKLFERGKQILRTNSEITLGGSVSVIPYYAAVLF